MLAHSLFVLSALTGLKLDWKSPLREANAIGWGDAARRFAWPGLVVGAALVGLFLTQPLAAVWMLPMALPLLLAVPLSVLTSRPSLGERARRARLLLTPEESWAPTVLRRAWSYAAGSAAGMQASVDATRHDEPRLRLVANAGRWSPADGR